MNIYLPYIYDSAITFETEPPSLEQFEGRIEKCLQKFPWLVCIVDDQVAGYVYASPHRDREAYQWTCECSVYVSEKYKGKGIGKTLYIVLFSILKEQGIRNVYAGITLPNEPSVILHERCGFEHFATYEQVGYKLDGWKTVGWWKLQLNSFGEKPAPPQLFSQMDRQLFTGRFQMAAESVLSKLTD
jgi:phosphinothricin acetyltransferase